jgi:hypothetical protein
LLESGFGEHIKDMWAHAFEWWIQRNHVPPSLYANLLDLAVLSGQKGLALRLARLGGDFSIGSASAIPRWLADASAQTPPSFVLHPDLPLDTKDEVFRTAMDVVRFQRKRSIHETMQVIAAPLLQAMSRATQKPRLPVLRIIGSFVAHRPALADLDTKVGSLFSSNGGALSKPSVCINVDTEERVTEDSPGTSSSVEKQVVDDTELERAIELSIEQAAQEEGSHVAAALVQSKAEAPPLSGDDVVAFRLTRHSRMTDKALLEGPQTAELRARVTDAGCELRPDFVGGAIFFIPMTREQYSELNFQLEPHHVVAIRADRPLLEAALARVPSKKRPTIKTDHRADGFQQEAAETAHVDSPGSDRPDASGDSLRSHLLEERTIGMLVSMVRHTFIHIPDHEEFTKKSVQSAPAVLLQ